MSWLDSRRITSEIITGIPGYNLYSSRGLCICRLFSLSFVHTVKPTGSAASWDMCMGSTLRSPMVNRLVGAYTDKTFRVNVLKLGHFSDGFDGAFCGINGYLGFFGDHRKSCDMVRVFMCNKMPSISLMSRPMPLEGFRRFSYG